MLSSSDSLIIYILGFIIYRAKNELITCEWSKSNWRISKFLCVRFACSRSSESVTITRRRLSAKSNSLGNGEIGGGSTSADRQGFSTRVNSISLWWGIDNRFTNVTLKSKHFWPNFCLCDIDDFYRTKFDSKLREKCSHWTFIHLIRTFMNIYFSFYAHL